MTVPPFDDRRPLGVLLLLDSVVSGEHCTCTQVTASMSYYRLTGCIKEPKFCEVWCAATANMLCCMLLGPLLRCLQRGRMDGEEAQSWAMQF